MSVEVRTDRPTGAALIGLALLSIVGWAIFANGATSLRDESRLQIALAALALVTVAGLLFSPRVRLRAPRRAFAGLALLVLFTGWCGLSLGWSPAPDLAWVQLNRWAAYTLVAGVALVLGSSLRTAPRRGAIGFLAVATATALYALGGKLVPWLEIPGLIDLDHAGDFSRLRAPLGYWNALALVCVLGTPVAIRIAADGDAPRRLRSVSIVALLVLLVALGLTYSRGGILALIVALAALVAIGPDRVRLSIYAALGVAAAVPAYLVAVVRDDLTTDGLGVAQRADDGLILLAVLLASGAAALAAGRRLRTHDERLAAASPARRPALNARAALAAVAAAVLIAIGVLAAAEGGVSSTVEREWQDFTSVQYDEQTDPTRVLRSNSGNRWVWWREAAGAFSDEPLRGWGAGSFPLVHRRYRDDRLDVRQPHSVPLQFLAETGIAGTLLGLGGLVLLAWAAIARLGLTAGRDRGYVAALLCAALAWGVHMWFDWDSDIPGVTLPLLAILGVLAARPPAPGDGAGAAPSPEDARASAGPRAAALLAAALVAAALVTSAYLPWLAEEKTSQAAIIGATGGEPALAEAAKRAEQAIRLNPLTVDPILTAVSVALQRGRYAEVADLLEEAVERQPDNPDVWLQVYIVQQLTDDAPARMDAARRVAQLDPQVSSIPFDAVVGNVAAASATATGTPLVERVLAPPPPAIGPPAPDAGPLVGPPRRFSSGGTTVGPPPAGGVTPVTPGFAPSPP